MIEQSSVADNRYRKTERVDHTYSHVIPFLFLDLPLKTLIDF